MPDSWKQVLRLFPVPAFSMDPASCVVKLWNLAAERAFGWKEAEVLNLPLERIIQGDSQGAPVTRRIASGSEFAGLPAFLRRKEDAAVAVELWTAAIAGPEGPEVLVVAMASSNTEAAIVDSLRALSGTLSHDLGNIVRATDGYLRLLSDVLVQVKPEVKRRKAANRLKAALCYTTVMHDALDHAAQIQENLRAFAGRLVLAPAPFDCKPLIDQFGQETREELRALRIEWDRVVEFGLPPVIADPAAIRGVLNILVDCSRRALPDGGSIVVECAAVEVKQPGPPSALQPGKYVTIAISDSRGPVEPKVLRAAFQPFSPLPQKSGLELAAAAGTLHASGGYLEACPTRSGVAFRMYVPAAAEVPSPVEEPVPGKETILVVNDEPKVLEFMRDVLAITGYTVFTAPDGKKALAWAEEHTGAIELLITDLVMPGMDGVTLATRVARIRPKIRVLIVSGYSNDSPALRGRGESFLEVPFTPEVLRRKVREVLDN